MFSNLYNDMMFSVSREPTTRFGMAPEMTEDEKFISFLNRYFIFRKVRNVAAERITDVINESMPSKDASICVNDARGFRDEVAEYEEEFSVEKISKTFQKREKIAEKEKAKENKLLLRPLGKTKITIGVYDPPVEDNAPKEITDLPIEDGPAIQLVPKVVRTGNKIKVKVPPNLNG